MLFGAGTDTTSVAGSLAFLACSTSQWLISSFRCWVEQWPILQGIELGLLPLGTWPGTAATGGRGSEGFARGGEHAALSILDANWVMSCDLRIFILWQYEFHQSELWTYRLNVLQISYPMQRLLICVWVVQGLSKDSLLQVSALWLEILRFNGPAPFEMLDRLKCCAFLFFCSVNLTSRLKGLTVPQWSQYRHWRTSVKQWRSWVAKCVLAQKSWKLGSMWKLNSMKWPHGEGAFNVTQESAIEGWFFLCRTAYKSTEHGSIYISHTSSGRKFALVEGLRHDLVCTGSIYHVRFAWQMWHRQLPPRFKFNKLKSFSGVEIDQNHVDKRIPGGRVCSRTTLEA